MRTTPAIYRPRPSTMPLAVRISVSMCSLITGARAGSRDASSVLVAWRQAELCALAKPLEKARNAKEEIAKRKIRFMDVIAAVSSEVLCFRFSQRLEWNDAALDRGGGGLSAIGDAEL